MSEIWFIYLSFTAKSAKMVQLHGITVLQNAYTHLLLLLGEATDIPGTHAASLATDALLKLRPQPKEAGRIYQVWIIPSEVLLKYPRTNMPDAKMLLRFYGKIKIAKPANWFFFSYKIQINQ